MIMMMIFFLEELNSLIENSKTSFCGHEIKNKDVLDNTFKYLDKDSIICVLLRGSFAHNRYNSYKSNSLGGLHK